MSCFHPAASPSQKRAQREAAGQLVRYSVSVGFSVDSGFGFFGLGFGQRFREIQGYYWFWWLAF